MMNATFIQTEAVIYRFRKSISGSSETARSIDRNDSWSRIASYARDEGFQELADVLERSVWRLSREMSAERGGERHFTTL